MSAELYIGAMSGTSLDGVDAVLARLHLGALLPPSSAVRAQAQGQAPGQSTPMAVGPEGIQGIEQLGHVQLEFPQALRQRILALAQGQPVTLAELGAVDVLVAHLYARAVKTLLQQTGVDATQVTAIGAHGQTVHHQPQPAAPGEPTFTTQIGDPNTLAVATGITVVADFRRRDMALGGQGAPLAPGFHELVWRHPIRTRVVLNCGGIANISVLKPGRPCIGFDTGPANILMDAWIEACQGLRYDRDAAWAAQGQVHAALLQALLRDPYFALPPPKSTGRERFQLAWLQQALAALPEPAPSDADVQRSLLELSACTIAQAVQAQVEAQAEPGELLVCGGGAFNPLLMRRLAELLPVWQVQSTAAHGVPPDCVEALAFAVFAQRTLHGQSANLPQVTGASRACLLGGVYRP